MFTRLHKLLTESPKTPLAALLVLVAGLVVGLQIGGQGFSNSLTALVGGSQFEVSKTTKSSQTKLTGTLTILHEDDIENRQEKTSYYLTDEGDDKTYKLDFGVNEPTELTQDGRVIVNGLINKSKDGSQLFVVSSYEVISAGQPRGGGGGNSGLGEQRLAVFLTNCETNPIEPYTIEEVREMVFGENFRGSINHFYREVSYNKTWFTGDVFGWYTLPAQYCSQSTFGTDLVISMADPEANFANYDRLMFVEPTSIALASFIPVSKVTQDGRFDFLLTFVGQNGLGRSLVLHEQAHNFGLNHGSVFDCGSVVISSNCTSVANYFGIEDGYFAGSPSVFSKEFLGWLEPSSYLVLDILQDPSLEGVYHLEPLETDSGGLKGIKIPLHGNSDGYRRNRDYNIEYRRPIGYDAALVSNGLAVDGIYDGPIISLAGTNFFQGGLLATSGLLDTSPHQTASPLEEKMDSLDIALREGKTFYDPVTQVSVHTIQVNNNGLDLFIGHPVCGDGRLTLPEECEGNDLSSNTCQTVGFRSGSLTCNADCTFNKTQCLYPVVCGDGHRVNSDGSCTAAIESDPHDASISALVSGPGAWDFARHQEVADILQERGYLTMQSFGNIGDGQMNKISRVSMSFDTNSIPDSALVESASLNLRGVSSLNNRFYPEDFILTVPVSLSSAPHLNINEFSRFGSIDNPEELTARLDLRNYDFSAGRRYSVSLALNRRGLEYLNKTGFTTIGLRSGYDLIDHLSRELQFNISAYSSDEASLNRRPTLTVNYRTGRPQKISP